MGHINIYQLWREGCDQEQGELGCQWWHGDGMTRDVGDVTGSRTVTRLTAAWETAAPQLSTHRPLQDQNLGPETLALSD